MGLCPSRLTSRLTSLFYDTPECHWDERDLAQVVLQASQEEHANYICASRLDDLCDAHFEEFRLVPEARTGRYLVWEFAPRVFRYFRESPRFCNCIRAQDWEESWHDTMQSRARGAKVQQLPAGKSGAHYVKSDDSHWMIKTIDKKEAEKQIEILREYVDHLDRNPDSLLMRHLQLLKVRELRPEGGGPPATKYLLVFENVAASAEVRCPRDCADALSCDVWDLKGRQPLPWRVPTARRLSGGAQSRAWRPRAGELPAVQHDLSRSFDLPPDVRQELLGEDSEQSGLLRRDAQFLARHNLMDYSLLIHAWPARPYAARAAAASPGAADADAQRLLSSAYDADTGMCGDAAEGLYLPHQQLISLERREAAAGWEGGWDPAEHGAQREALELCAARRCPVRVGRRCPQGRKGDPRRGRIHKFHNGIVSAAGDEVYFIGVIDILTEYNAFKRAANCCKRFAFFEEQLSTIPADKYERRFSRYTQEVFPDWRSNPRCTASPAISPARPPCERRAEWLKRRRVGDELPLLTEGGGGGDARRAQRRNWLRWQYASVRDGARGAARPATAAPEPAHHPAAS